MLEQIILLFEAKKLAKNSILNLSIDESILFISFLDTKSILNFKLINSQYKKLIENYIDNYVNVEIISFFKNIIFRLECRVLLLNTVDSLSFNLIYASLNESNYKLSYDLLGYVINNNIRCGLSKNFVEQPYLGSLCNSIKQVGPRFDELEDLINYNSVNFSNNELIPNGLNSKGSDIVCKFRTNQNLIQIFLLKNLFYTIVYKGEHYFNYNQIENHNIIKIFFRNEDSELRDEIIFLTEDGSIYYCNYESDNFIPQKIIINEDKIINVYTSKDRTAFLGISGNIYIYGNNNNGQIGFNLPKNIDRNNLQKIMISQEEIVGIGLHSLYTEFVTKSGAVYNLGITYTRDKNNDSIKNLYEIPTKIIEPNNLINIFHSNFFKIYQNQLFYEFNSILKCINSNKTDSMFLPKVIELLRSISNKSDILFSYFISLAKNQRDLDLNDNDNKFKKLIPNCY